MLKPLALTTTVHGIQSTLLDDAEARVLFTGAHSEFIAARRLLRIRAHQALGVFALETVFTVARALVANIVTAFVSAILAFLDFTKQAPAS